MHGFRNSLPVWPEEKGHPRSPRRVCDLGYAHVVAPSSLQAVIHTDGVLGISSANRCRQQEDPACKYEKRCLDSCLAHKSNTWRGLNQGFRQSTALGQLYLFRCCNKTWERKRASPSVSNCIGCRAHHQSRQEPVPQAHSCGPWPACATMQAACPDPQLPCAHCTCKPEFCRSVMLRIPAPGPLEVRLYKNARVECFCMSTRQHMHDSCGCHIGLLNTEAACLTQSTRGQTPGRDEKRPESIVHGLVPLVHDASLIECAAWCSFVSLLLP